MNVMTNEFQRYLLMKSKAKSKLVNPTVNDECKTDQMSQLSVVKNDCQVE